MIGWPTPTKGMTTRDTDTVIPGFHTPNTTTPGTITARAAINRQTPGASGRDVTFAFGRNRFLCFDGQSLREPNGSVI